MTEPSHQIRFKLYAGLARYLPEGARDNAVLIGVAPGTTAHQIIDGQGVPRQLAHLVLRNGLYLTPRERDEVALADGDTLAIWPPVAGG